jgi:hypothetical protein
MTISSQNAHSIKSLAYVLIRQRTLQFELCARELRLPRKQFHCALNLALLQIELRQCGHRCFALRIDLQGFVAASLGSSHIMLPLEEGEALVNEREDIQG